MKGFCMQKPFLTNATMIGFSSIRWYAQFYRLFPWFTTSTLLDCGFGTRFRCHALLAQFSAWSTQWYLDPGTSPQIFRTGDCFFVNQTIRSIVIFNLDALKLWCALFVLICGGQNRHSKDRFDRLGGFGPLFVWSLGIIDILVGYSENLASNDQVLNPQQQHPCLRGDNRPGFRRWPFRNGALWQAGRFVQGSVAWDRVKNINQTLLFISAI